MYIFLILSFYTFCTFLFISGEFLVITQSLYRTQMCLNVYIKHIKALEAVYAGAQNWAIFNFILLPLNIVLSHSAELVKYRVEE